jgi:ABC-type lipoprotein release transport system permease subunit
MNPVRYIIRAIWHYKKQQLAVFTGTLISAAVITGAMLIGDSVNFSLHRLLDLRLGKIDLALNTGDRFVTESLAIKLGSDPDLQVSGMLSLPGMAVDPGSGKWIPEVQIHGTDSSFWSFSPEKKSFPGKGEAGISVNVAERLGITVGDEVLVRTENVDAVPVNSPFSDKDEPLKSIRLTVGSILDNTEFGRYSLASDQKSPYNVFIDKRELQEALGIEAKINTLIIDQGNNQLTQEDLDEKLNESWSISDASLRIKSLDTMGTLELTSERVFIDSIVEQKVLEHFSSARPVLTYLVNGIRSENGYTPYSFASGVPSSMLNRELDKGDVLLNKWCADDLGVTLGDSVELSFYTVGPMQKLEKDSAVFRVAGILPIGGTVFNRELAADFPGLSDASNCRDWNSDLPIDLEKIRDKDEDYWDDFKGTPKAILPVEEAKKQWGNRYGSSTAIRVDSREFVTSPEEQIIRILEPRDLGFAFIPVRKLGINAASNGVDFRELFLSLGFFIIASAILLLILLYSLNLLSREKEINTLISLGLPANRILVMFAGESTPAILTGSAIGALLGILYNKFALIGLNTIWQDAVRMDELVLHVKGQTLLAGFLMSAAIALGTIILVFTRRFRKLHKNESRHSTSPAKKKKTGLKGIALLLIFSSLMLAGISWVGDQLTNSSLFLAAGAMLIIGLIMTIHLFWLNPQQWKSGNIPGIAGMGARNLGRNRIRSTLSVSLMALGTFSVLITGSNRQTFSGSEHDRNSGTGGFAYWMETSIPIIRDPNTERGREAYQLSDEPLVDSLTFVPLLTLSGDDASCLNLNQVEKPGILGVDPVFFDRKNAFTFISSTEGIPEENPWLGLELEMEKQVIPAYIDQTVLTWGLMKSLGDTLKYTDDFGRELNLVISGTLNNTIFQGYVLISAKNMQQYFPSVAGANIVLLDTEIKDDASLRERIGFSFRDYGLEMTTTGARMKAFYSVTNTYLNVFLMLGALGLLIGTVGFGIVLQRNLLERKRELALLQAIGFSPGSIRRLMFIEHTLLLITGLLVGSAGAFIGMLPSLLTPVFSVPMDYLGVFVLIILLSGMGWIFISSRTATVPSPAQALRGE